MLAKLTTKHIHNGPASTFGEDKWSKDSQLMPMKREDPTMKVTPPKVRGGDTRLSQLLQFVYDLHLVEFIHGPVTFNTDIQGKGGKDIATV